MIFKIKAATSSERDEWVRMRRKLWPECSAERHVLEIEQLLGSRTAGIVLIAMKEDGALCGFAEISIRHDHVEGTSAVPVPYLEGWYVDENARGKGVGRELLRTAEKWARDHGFNELASDAELANENSIRTHLECGFKEICRTVHFVKTLGTCE